MNTKSLRNPIQLVTLLSRMPGKADFGTRNRFSTEHSDFRAGKISFQQLIDVAELAKTRWQVHEPNTEFKIEVHTWQLKKPALTKWVI